MFLLLRTLTIICLVMLQLIAPLVHAHTGEQLFNTGLHIPGLEVYSRADHSEITPVLHLSSQRIDTEGFLVGIDTGLKAKYHITLDDTDSPVYITPSAVIVKTTLSQYDTNFSPQPRHVVVHHIVSAHPARAPPYCFPV